MRNRIRRALAALMVVLGLSTGLVAVTAAPAHASFSWCTYSAQVCFATNTDGNGTRWHSQLLPVGQCIGVPHNDAYDSLWNKYTTGSVTVYENNPCGGYLFTYGPGAFVQNVGWFWHDEISAVCLGPRGGSNGCP